MGLDWRQLVEERNAWVAYNFPTQKGKRPGHSAMGVIEELGELTHHHLKQEQNIRGDDDHHEAGGKDAVGDLLVYLLGVMNYVDHTPRTPRPSPAPAEQWLFMLTSQVGKLANLYFGANVRDYHPVIDGIVTGVAGYCQARGWDHEAILQETWDAVKRRDWIRYPDTGLPPVAGEEDNPIVVASE